MESKYKAKLKSIILDLRHILEGYYGNNGVWHPGDMEERLAALGVRRDRESLPFEQLSHLSEEDRLARLIVDAFIQSAPLSERSREESVAQFLQEASYTWANRLIALRCMEARGLIDEIIIQKESYGGRSLKHHRLTRQNPEVCAGEDDGLYAALFAEFVERAEELPLLFHPDEPVIALTPGVAALKKCIQLLSADDEIFTAPDALGWAYQYWNTEEKDRVFEKVRTVKGAKIEKGDIIPVTQLYTEPYMVKFLVQNSLGALWMAMHPASRLSESWEYYVRDADRATVERKSLKQLSFLDPSVGSGHFLLEAFDLLFAMYMEDGELKTPGEICEAILSRNLFGIDIDERAIQIAACALYMKAKEKDRAFRPTRINLTATNIHIGADIDHLAAFLEKHPEGKPFQTSLQLIFESLRHADELGTLLQIEEPVEKKFRFLKALDDEEKAGPPKQKALFAEMEKPEQAPLPIGVPSYEEWKAGLLARLSEHFREEFASADFSSRFFGETAGKGLSLFDFLSRRYDVVATNPPYMGSKNMGPVVKRYVETHFPSGKRDLYAAFILRCLQLAKPETGRVAMVTQQSWMFLRSFINLRLVDKEKVEPCAFKGVLQDTTIDTLVHLGPGAFSEISGEVVNCALFTIIKIQPDQDHRLKAFRIINPKNAKEKDLYLREAIRGNGNTAVFMPLQNQLVEIPQSPICYWVPSQILRMFVDMRKYSDVGKVPKGLTTGDNNRFLRYFWEGSQIGERWFPYVKAGTSTKWWGLNHYCVDWEDSGVRIKNFFSADGKLRSRPQNVKYYFKQGHTYSEMAGGVMGCRFLPKGTIFDARSPGLFIEKDSPEITICLLNSRVTSYMLRTISPTLLFDQAYIPNIPCPVVQDQSIRKQLCNIYNLSISLKRYICTLDMTEVDFLLNSDSFWYINFYKSQLLPVSTILNTLESLNERLVLRAFALNQESSTAILSEINPPVGWNSLISGYDDVVGLEHISLKLEKEEQQDIKEVQSQAIELVDRLSFSKRELSDLKGRLRFLFEAGPGTREKTDEVDTNVSDVEEEGDDEISAGAIIPIPAETFMEELSQKLDIHPISIYWILKEGIEKEGWRCLPEEGRIIKDRFTVLILRLVGHRWPKQIEAGEALPDWADDDGIIPMMEGTEESTLYQGLRSRIAADYGDDQVSSQENAFEEVMGKLLSEWLKKDFFRHHISQFKKRPIAWHLSSARWTGRLRQDAAFECMVYYHKTDGDLLPKLKNQYVIPLIKRMETELRGLENANGRLTGEQEARKSLLMERIQELKAFDAVLTDVGASGFCPDVLQPQLRQFAINDAMLCLKARWLKRLSSVIQEGPLTDWRRQADETGLHAEFSIWITGAFVHLDYHCSVVGPKPPEEKDYADDPTATDLAKIICAEAEIMFSGALKYACLVWWKSFDATILKPISEKIRDAKKKLQVLKERSLDPKGDFKEQSEMKRKMSALKSNVKAWQQEMAVKFGQGHAVREAIDAWPCPEALTWETWLSEQAMYDQLSSRNGVRRPPQTIAEFIRQEGLYQPDINDGVRVNIAPLQKAGLLTADVLAGKDVDKAIADRAAWRDDERRWCREGKLPKPGWWE